MGINDSRASKALALQFVASQRREEYYKIVQQRDVSPRRADPNVPLFDPEKAVAYHTRSGDMDEASWLVFLMTYFAKPFNSGWLRLSDVYGALGAGIWDWKSTIVDTESLVRWTNQNWQYVRGTFGNHRKYESLDPRAHRNFQNAVVSYVNWIGPGGHETFFNDAVRHSGNDPTVIFDRLYREMNVDSFGRLGKFDYLSMVGRYRIAPICAGSAYLQGSTGPTRGARLLFEGSSHGYLGLRQMQERLDSLDEALGVGMTVMEDALCNWQKSPTQFVHFRG